jgi:hypothetical protein
MSEAKKRKLNINYEDIREGEEVELVLADQPIIDKDGNY